jgi:hypothetical protein
MAKRSFLFWNTQHDETIALRSGPEHNKSEGRKPNPNQRGSPKFTSLFLNPL